MGKTNDAGNVWLYIGTKTLYMCVDAYISDEVVLNIFLLARISSKSRTWLRAIPKSVHATAPEGV